MNWTNIALTGWGRSSTARVRACRPERQSELETVLDGVDAGGIIAYAAGRSYGDAALNDGGATVLTRRLDRILAFDPATGEVVCEPGVTFRDLFDAFVPRGFMAAASPGTAATTVGGAVANDVHGKNHDRHGSFGDHVRWIELIQADGTIQRVSPDDDSELFAATIGGIGLTGLIRAVCFRLLPGASPKAAVRETRVKDLDDFLAAFARVRDSTTFSVGWIDGLARGAALGRGILETAECVPAEQRPPERRGPNIPVDLPGFALNSLTVRLFNEVWFRRASAAGRERVRPLSTFLYPLDAIGNWNRIYGRRGFYQFQCVLPEAESVQGLRALLEETGRARKASFLAVLKTLGGEGRGHLSFPMRGHTLALDFPRRSGVEEVLRRLTHIVRDRGGRVYLAKDALLSAEDFRTMYPKLPRFLDVLARVDPAGRFTSNMARRLDLKPARSTSTAP